MEELTGHLVMVHPNLKNDPVQRQGEIGIITSADLAKDEVYVGFGNNSLGLYSTDALLMLKHPSVIYGDILTHIKELDIPDFKMLMEITLLQEKNSVNYLRDAMELAATNEKTLAYSTVSMQEALGVVLDEAQSQSQKAYLSR
jgi:hypothetical protein